MQQPNRLLLLIMSISLWSQCVNVLMAVSRITHYTTKFEVVYLTWQWFEIASTVTRFKSSWAPLGSDGTGNSNNGRAAGISAANVWFYVNMDQNLQERFPGYGWIYTVPLGIKAILRGKGGSNPVLARCKWWRDLGVHVHFMAEKQQ